MKTIYKYPLKIQATQDVEMPYGSKILSLQMQHETPSLWVEIDLESKDSFPWVTREFHFKGTGHAFNNKDLNYIGTVLEDGGTFVWHLYERLV